MPKNRLSFTDGLTNPRWCKLLKYKLVWDFISPKYHQPSPWPDSEVNCFGCGLSLLSLRNSLGFPFLYLPSGGPGLAEVTSPVASSFLMPSACCWLLSMPPPSGTCCCNLLPWLNTLPSPGFHSYLGFLRPCPRTLASWRRMCYGNWRSGSLPPKSQGMDIYTMGPLPLPIGGSSVGFCRLNVSLPDNMNVG